MTPVVPLLTHTPPSRLALLVSGHLEIASMICPMTNKDLDIDTSVLGIGERNGITVSFVKSCTTPYRY